MVELGRHLLTAVRCCSRPATLIADPYDVSDQDEAWVTLIGGLCAGPVPSAERSYVFNSSGTGVLLPSKGERL